MTSSRASTVPTPLANIREVYTVDLNPEFIFPFACEIKKRQHIKELLRQQQEQTLLEQTPAESLADDDDNPPTPPPAAAASNDKKNSPKNSRQPVGVDVVVPLLTRARAKKLNQNENIDNNNQQAVVAATSGGRGSRKTPAGMAKGRNSVAAAFRAKQQQQQENDVIIPEKQLPKRKESLKRASAGASTVKNAAPITNGTAAAELLLSRFTSFDDCPAMLDMQKGSLPPADIDEGADNVFQVDDDDDNTTRQTRSAPHIILPVYDDDNADNEEEEEEDDDNADNEDEYGDSLLTRPASCLSAVIKSNPIKRRRSDVQDLQQQQPRERNGMHAIRENNNNNITAAAAQKSSPAVIAPPPPLPTAGTVSPLRTVRFAPDTRFQPSPTHFDEYLPQVAASNANSPRPHAAAVAAAVPTNNHYELVTKRVGNFEAAVRSAVDNSARRSEAEMTTISTNINKARNNTTLFGTHLRSTGAVAVDMRQTVEEFSRINIEHDFSADFSRLSEQLEAASYADAERTRKVLEEKLLALRSRILSSTDSVRSNIRLMCQTLRMQSRIIRQLLADSRLYANSILQFVAQSRERMQQLYVRMLKDNMDMLRELGFEQSQQPATPSQQNGHAAAPAFNENASAAHRAVSNGSVSSNYSKQSNNSRRGGGRSG